MTRSRSRRALFALVMVVALIAPMVMALPASAAKGSGPAVYPVAGCTIPLNDPPSNFTYEGATVIAEREVLFALFPCPTDPTANGFESFDAPVYERVVRIGGRGMPYFTMTATQEIHGWLWINGTPLQCDIYQSLTATGPLFPDLALDDQDQGATALSGTWQINPGSTCEGMRVRGSGTLEWDGVWLPTYKGAVIFQRPVN